MLNLNDAHNYFKEEIYMTIKPLADRVVIKMVEAEETPRAVLS